MTGMAARPGIGIGALVGRVSAAPVLPYSAP
jgi:hypothetical protein